MAAYATYEEYVEDTGDESTGQARVEAMLGQQSAKLRALLGIPSDLGLTDDQQLLARSLVTDSVRKAVNGSSMEGLGDVAGASQASFSANGFDASMTFSNPSGTAYFDRSTLSALRLSLGRGQRFGAVTPR